MQIKVGIVGLGAIGSVIAKTLHSNEKIELRYYTRTPKLFIKVKYDSEITTIPIKCESFQHAEEKLDWVIICLKAHQIKSANNLLQTLIKPDTKVAIIRNGINLAEDLTPYTKKEMILPAIIDCSVQPDGEGYYTQLKHPDITTPKNDLSITFEDLFPKEDLTVNMSDDFKTDVWKKLIESASIGGLQCLNRKACQIFHDERVLNIYRELIKEGIKVAKLEGVLIDNKFEEHLLSKVLTYPKDKGSSMLTDLLQNKEIELEAKNGAISKIAKKHGASTLLHDFICFFIEQKIYLE